MHASLPSRDATSMPCNDASNSPPLHPAIQVASWLHSVHLEACGSAAAGSSPGPPPSPQQAAAASLARPDALALTLAVLRCFTAWAKWGCLQYVEHAHAAYFAGLTGELLFAADPARGLPYHPACLPAAVDAATEIVEHCTEALQPLLLQLATALPARAAALRSGGAEDEAAELAHVFALFCSTHCTLCAAEGPQGQALRQVGGGQAGGWGMRAASRSCGCCRHPGLTPAAPRATPCQCRRGCSSCLRCPLSPATTPAARLCLRWAPWGTC